MVRPLNQKFYGDLYKAKDNSKVPSDEWVAFLTHDNAFAAILPLYLEECIRLGADEAHIEATIRLISRVDAWRKAHPDRLKVPDAAGERMLE